MVYVNKCVMFLKIQKNLTILNFLVYFDADDGCHDLNLSLGQNAYYATIPSNRQVSIKVSIKIHLHKDLIGIYYGNYFLVYTSIGNSNRVHFLQFGTTRL